jgi:Tol biopolymer transport system component
MGQSFEIEPILKKLLDKHKELVEMKKLIPSVLVIMALFILAACTADQTEPIAATRPAVTAVPDQPTPSPSPTPVLTPFATELPSFPTPPVLSDGLDPFVQQLQRFLVDPNYGYMQATMSDPIAVGAWRSEWRMYDPAQMVAEFQNNALPAPSAVQFTGLSTEEITSLIGQPPASLFDPATNVVAALHSTGWGQSASDEAILFITEQDGRYVWSAFLYTTGPFADASPSTVAAPVGLIYTITDNGLYQVQPDGQPRQLLDAQTANTPNLRVAPDGRHAAYINDEQQLWLIDTATGEQQQLAADFTTSGYLSWGDKDTLFVGIWLDPSEGEGPNNGHIATLDITSGDLFILDETRLSSGRPSLLSDYNLIAFDVSKDSQDDIFSGRIYHPDSGVQTFDQTAYAGHDRNAIANPVWSPDPNKIAWLTGGGGRFMVQLFDIEAKTAVTIFDWDPARFGALVPSPVWSPDGQWLALEVWANGPEGSGLWLLAADGSSQTLVDADGHDPYWVNADLLVYNLNDGPRLYDVASAMAFKMDLPEGSWVLGVTNEADLQAQLGPQLGPQSDASQVTDTATPQANLPDPAELEMTTTTAASPDGRWQATVSQSEPVTVGDGEQFYASLTIENGSTTWEPVAGWRAYGLGYVYPAVYQWSQDSRYLYYTNKIAVDGCAVFLNATDLYRFDVRTGDNVELLSSGLTWDLALSPDETSLAYTSFNGQSIVVAVRDIATGNEQSVAVADTGPDAQSGNIVWSPDGTQLLLTVAHDPCGSNWTHSIIRLNVAAVTAVTLIEKDARQFTIMEWPNAEGTTARLTDKAGQIWLLDLDSGDLTAE